MRRRSLSTFVVALAVGLAATTPVGDAGPPGHHSLKITGPKKQEFLDRLAFLTKEDLSFEADGETVKDNGNKAGVFYSSLRNIKDIIIGDGTKTVVVKTEAGPTGHLVDEFDDPKAGDTTIDGAVDWDDISRLPRDVEVDRNKDGVADAFAAEGTWIDTNGDGIPDTPDPNATRFPWAETQGSAIAHILGERYFAINNATNFNDYADPKQGANAHELGGVRFGDAVKAERARDEFTNVGASGVKEKEFTGNTLLYTDGSKEIYKFGPNGVIESIEYVPGKGAKREKEPKPRPNKMDLETAVCLLDVGPAPTMYSGREAVFQTVTYQVVEVLSGRYTHKEIAIEHAIVRGKGDVDPNIPQLLASVFHDGAGLIVRTQFVDSELLGEVHVAHQAVTPSPQLSC